MRITKSYTLLAAAALTLCPALLAQGNSAEGRLRALNAQALQLRGTLASAGAGNGAVHSQAATALAQRQTVLQGLMASQPAKALELAFPAEVVDDLAEAFPESAAEPSITLHYASSVLSSTPGVTGSATLTAATTGATPLNVYSISAAAEATASSNNASLTVALLPPAVPGNFTGTAVFSGRGKNKVFQYIRLNWTDVSGETSYTLQRCKVTGKGASATCTYAILPTVINANVVTVNDNPGASGTYKYQILANKTGTTSPGWSTAAQVTY